MKCPEQANPSRQETDRWLPGAGRGRKLNIEGEGTANAGFHFWVNALEIYRSGGYSLGIRNNGKKTRQIEEVEEISQK